MSDSLLELPKDVLTIKRRDAPRSFTFLVKAGNYSDSSFSKLNDLFVRDHRLNASFPLFQLQQPTRINPVVGIGTKPTVPRESRDALHDFFVGDLLAYHISEGNVAIND